MMVKERRRKRREVEVIASLTSFEQSLGMAAPAEEEKYREEPCYCWLFWRFNAPRTKTAKMVNRALTVLTQTAVVHDVQSIPTIPHAETHCFPG
ncbi:putative glucarate dehydratase [Fusarium oxysporum f. sp. albedinis]|nr:putative glucarate dehydratase [Fusarium oxysporum f. sp. albedinis]